MGDIEVQKVDSESIQEGELTDDLSILFAQALKHAIGFPSSFLFRQITLLVSMYLYRLNSTPRSYDSWSWSCPWCSW